MAKINIKDLLQEHIDTIQNFVKTNSRQLDHLSGAIAVQLDFGKKILICGNGGSAADAQHLAAELVGRFEKERRALPAISLVTDTSILTAIANDYSYEQVFSKQVEALGQDGDVLIAITTSGKSPNIVQAMKQAKKQNMTVVLITGANGKGNEIADIVIDVPSTNTARIQECHIFCIHYLAKVVEDYFIDKETK